MAEANPPAFRPASSHPDIIGVDAKGVNKLSSSAVLIRSDETATLRERLTQAEAKIQAIETWIQEEEAADEEEAKAIGGNPAPWLRQDGFG